MSKDLDIIPLEDQIIDKIQEITINILSNRLGKEELDLEDIEGVVIHPLEGDSVYMITYGIEILGEILIDIDINKENVSFQIKSRYYYA